MPRKKARITSRQINIARELLDMMYKPPEFARELFVDEQKVREWAEQGMPCEKDENNILWIHGTKAGTWLVALKRGSQ